MNIHLFLLDAATNCDINCTTWWLHALLASLLAGLLTWLLFGSGLKKRINELTIECDGLRAKATNLEKDLAARSYELEQALAEITRLKGLLAKCESDKVVLETKLSHEGDGAGNRGLGIAAMPTDTGERGGTNYTAILGADNLQIVEGIGPKIDALLKAEGIQNWADLAVTPVDTIKGILDKAGSNFRLADPTTWPRQAELAANNQWDELIEYQKFLDTGSDKKGDLDSPSKVEKMVAKILGFSTNPEDLKIVEGIGPKIEGLLKADGINTWADLAAASIDRIQAILDAAGDRYRLADPTSWPKQAGLAAEGKWGELNEYQEFLDGGKEPTA